MQGCNLQTADYDKRTALHLAACEGHLEIVQFLLNIAKVRIDSKDRYVNILNICLLIFLRISLDT